MNLAGSGARLTAVLPRLSYLVLGLRAETVMPAVRDWMSSHTWLINIGACLLFIALIVF